MARLSGTAQQHGRKALNAQDRVRIRERLRTHVRRRYKTTALFTRTVGLPQSTVTGWFDNEAPHTPDVAQLIKIAKRSGLSLDWLLLGEPSEYRGAVRPAEKIAGRFRQALVDELFDRELAARKEIEALLPDADHILEAAVSRYTEWTRQRLPLYRELAAVREETQGWMIYEIEGQERKELGSLGIMRKMRKDLKSRRKVAEGVKAWMNELKQDPGDT